MKGTYVLEIAVRKPFSTEVGAIGKINFPTGHYAYVGSALNSLESRISRHISQNKKTFWHIDYLLKQPFASVSRVFYREGIKKEECKTAKKISKFAHSVQSFGSSDCNCKTHLFKTPNKLTPRKLEMEVWK